ncbi:MAG: RecB family exonuclease [Acidimicrobiales bacterium]
MALAPPSSLTPSKVTAFTGCALAFRFSVIDGLPEPPSVAAARGTVVHRALERLHRAPPPGRTLDAALGWLGEVAAEVLADPEHVGLELTPGAERELLADADGLVRRYFALEDPTQVTPIGLELKLEATLGGVRLRGIIDRLELDADGELVVTDYKTGTVPSPRHERDRLGGVHFYAYLCQVALGRRPARVQLLYLSEPVAIVATPSDQSIRGLERRVAAVWSAVTRACAGEDFRPNPGRRCAWCAYRPLCPAFGGDPAAARAVAAGIG